METPHFVTAHNPRTVSGSCVDSAGYGSRPDSIYGEVTKKKHLLGKEQ